MGIHKINRYAIFLLFFVELIKLLFKFRILYYVGEHKQYSMMAKYCALRSFSKYCFFSPPPPPPHQYAHAHYIVIQKMIHPDPLFMHC